ncbi:MAG: cellulase family glycosylhydrolase [Methylococcaceae bacterium]|nr:cellulase family glycosylhydrolase [Methylococcaceae bacterium]
MTDNTLPVVSSKYVGWEENWQWAGFKIKPARFIESGNAGVKNYQGQVPNLDIDFLNTITGNKSEFVWTYDWSKKAGHPDSLGVGVEFNLKTNSPTFDSTTLAVPEALPNNEGWRWQTPDGEKLEVKFSPPLAKIAQDSAKPNLIRAFFFKGIVAGSEKTSMTVTITHNSSAKSASVADPQSYENIEAQKWHKDILSDNESPVDLSFLNANDLPAGKHGFVKAKSDQLVFEDGTPTKFWGANLIAYSLFQTSESDIKKQAKRIAKLGFNLIRIHHHDSNWVNPNIFGNKSDNTQTLSAEAFKKLDWWIKCLKDEGIYVWLDLHVGRSFTEKDGVENFNELFGKKGRIKGGKELTAAQGKGFNYYNESIQKQMQRFSEAYLTHVNTYTGLPYLKDPAVVTLLITNENDLTQHFGNILLANKGVPEHNALFSNDMKSFSERAGFKANKTGRVWEMGEPKIYLADAEHRFNQKMISHLRGLGAKSLIATTNSWGKMGLFGLPSLTDGDIIDTHSYGHAEEFNFDPRYNPSFLTWIGAAQVTGMPLAASEWNMASFPIDDRFTAPIYTASIAGFQGWDAMMLYGYSQSKFGPNSPASNFSCYNDPAIMGLMPAAALLYRQSHVSLGKQSYELKLSRDDFYYKNQDPNTSKTLRTLLETSRFTVTLPEIPELPWLKSSKSATKPELIVTDANKDFIPQGQNFIQSDTGELKRDWQKGIHTINTSKSQIASGWIGGAEIKLQDVTFKANTKKAVIAVQSMDDKSIKQSKNLFITIMARSITENGNKLPFLSEPVTGEIVINAPDNLKLFPLSSLGKKGKAINANYTKGSYHVKLDEKNKAHWFMLSTD